MKTFVLSALLAFLPACNAFHVQRLGRSSVPPLHAKKIATDSADEHMLRRHFIKAVGGLASASMFLGNGEVAQAFDPTSINVAEEIKTLDFSLPTYDSISSSKASVETVDGLAVEVKKEKAPKTKPQKAPREPKEPGENPLASVLPSMKKGPASSKGDKQKGASAPKAPRKEKEQAAPAVETMDLSLPSYSGSTSGKEKSVFSI